MNNMDSSLYCLRRHLQTFNPKMKRLIDLDLFVLDNSIRETTVGQLRGHTLENKWAIYEEVKKAGFKYCIVESFSHMTRLGDTFLRQLKEKGEDMSFMFAFTDFIEVIDGNRIPQEDIPIGLIKSRDLGVKNVVMEVDLLYHGIDYNVFNGKKLCSLLLRRLQWIRENLSHDSLVFINFRDFSECMKYHPRRVFKLVNYLSCLPPSERPFGIMYEELGKYFPEEVGAWTYAVRQEMNLSGWTDGHLLAHVHQQWGMSDSTQIECLSNGATGIWAGMCEEGAAMGHASSCVTIMNLVRMGNRKVTKNFNCHYLRNGAQNITNITTGKCPHPKQPVYGARSLDIIFGFDPVKNKTEFDFAAFLGIQPEIRITTLAKPEMFVEKLVTYFGEDEQFTLEMGQQMKEQLLVNLHQNRKEEANSKVGLVMLFDQSGGKLTDVMSRVIEEDNSISVHISELIEDIRERWDMWQTTDVVNIDEMEFDAFYNGFMSPYFGCYRCEDSRRGLKAIDMDNDGKVDWREFCLYLKWAGRQYPDTKTADDLLDIAFRKGLIPSMKDEIVGVMEASSLGTKKEELAGANAANNDNYFDNPYDEDSSFLNDDDSD